MERTAPHLKAIRVFEGGPLLPAGQLEQILNTLETMGCNAELVGSAARGTTFNLPEKPSDIDILLKHTHGNLTDFLAVVEPLILAANHIDGFPERFVITLDIKSSDPAALPINVVLCLNHDTASETDLMYQNDVAIRLGGLTGPIDRRTQTEISFAEWFARIRNLTMLPTLNTKGVLRILRDIAYGRVRESDQTPMLTGVIETVRNDPRLAQTFESVLNITRVPAKALFTSLVLRTLALPTEALIAPPPRPAPRAPFYGGLCKLVSDLRVQHNRKSVLAAYAKSVKPTD